MNDRDKRLRDRTNAFFDGVTAIAITLAIVDIDILRIGNNPTMESLKSLIPDFTAFFISFLALSNIWTNHTQFYARIDYFKSWVLRENVILMLLISVFPKLTELILRHPSNSIIRVTYISIYFLMTFIELSTMIKVFFAYRKKNLKFMHQDHLDFIASNISHKIPTQDMATIFKKIKIEIISDILSGIINLIAVVISILSIFVQPLICYIIFLINIIINSSIKYMIKRLIQ